MSDAKTAQHLLEELAEVLDPVAILADAEEDAWAIQLDDETIVELVLDPERRVVVFSADLGPLPEAGAAAASDLLLRFAYLWQQTGGVRAALDEDGDAVLVTEAGLAGLDLPQLQNILGRLLRHRRSWAEVLDGLAEGSDTAEPDEPGLPKSVYV